MRNHPRNLQNGQAMSEFIAAMALFIPLTLGVIYVGKYGDIKHQAIQASRYAAMERALDPSAHESNAVIKNETVARFFRDGGRYVIARDEQAQEATRGDENPNWSQINGDPLLAHYADIEVSFASPPAAGNGGNAPIDSDLLKPVNAASGQFFNELKTGFGVQARVEVPVANVANFSPLSNINLRIGASTVIAGDPWNAAGGADVANHMTVISVPGRALKQTVAILNNPVLTRLFGLFVDTPPPQFGCVKPDVVPEGTAPGALYDPTDNPISPSNPNDKCY